MRTLVGEAPSPWSEKARWALDHHRLPYAYREHYPLIGELSLRLRARRLRGRVSTPLLLTPEGGVMDSLRIAQYAEQHGSGAPLFAAGHEAEVLGWSARSEAALMAARVLYLDRLGHDRAAKRELQPGSFPRPVRRLALPLVDLAVSFLRRKYGMPDSATAAASLERELQALRSALAGGRRYLVGEGFSYADIAMAVTLQFVSPVAGRYIPLGPAARRACTHPQLAARFEDLVAWRDALYARHRRAG